MNSPYYAPRTGSPRRSDSPRKLTRASRLLRGSGRTRDRCTSGRAGSYSFSAANLDGHEADAALEATAVLLCQESRGVEFRYVDESYVS